MQICTKTLRNQECEHSLTWQEVCSFENSLPYKVMLSASAGAEKKINSKYTYNHYTYLESVWVIVCQESHSPFKFGYMKFYECGMILLQVLTNVGLIDERANVKLPCQTCRYGITLLLFSKKHLTDQTRLVLKPWTQQMWFQHVGTMFYGSTCLGISFNQKSLHLEPNLWIVCWKGISFLWASCIYTLGDYEILH